MNISLLPLIGSAANCYVLSSGKKAALVDIGEDCPNLRRFCESTDLEIEYILLTHGHFDHIGGVAAAKEYFPDAKICIGRADGFMTQSAKDSLGSRFGFDHPTFKADVLLADGDVITLGEDQIRVMHTPGHTKGGVIYLAGSDALCGDTIFNMSIGRCDFPGSDIEEMKASLKKIAALQPETNLYPGHGPATTVGNELKHNPYLREEIWYSL